MAQPYRRKTRARRELRGVQRLRGDVSHGRDAAGTGKQRLHPLLKMRARLSKTRAMCASFARSQLLSAPPQMQRYSRVSELMMHRSEKQSAFCGLFSIGVDCI